MSVESVKTVLNNRIVDEAKTNLLGFTLILWLLYMLHDACTWVPFCIACFFELFFIFDLIKAIKIYKQKEKTSK